VAFVAAHDPGAAAPPPTAATPPPAASDETAPGPGAPR
jgi:hypothetical protein